MHKMPRSLRKRGRGWERLASLGSSREGEGGVRWRICTSSGDYCPGQARLMRRSAEPSFAAIGSGYNLDIRKGEQLPPPFHTKCAEEVCVETLGHGHGHGHGKRSCCCCARDCCCCRADARGCLSVGSRSKACCGERRAQASAPILYTPTHHICSWAREVLLWRRGSGLSSNRVR